MSKIGLVLTIVLVYIVGVYLVLKMTKQDNKKNNTDKEYCKEDDDPMDVATLAILWPLALAFTIIISPILIAKWLYEKI